MALYNSVIPIKIYQHGEQTSKKRNMKTKFIFTLFSIALFNFSLYGQSDKITINEFKQIVGKWKGKLIYLDYTSNKPYEMPSDLEVVQIDKAGKFKFINSYPNESSANSIDTVSVNDNGRKIDDEIVKSKRNLKNGNLEINTEILGKDGNDDKPALIRHIYTIGKKELEIKKEVQFVGTLKWILRHTYKYSKK